METQRRFRSGEPVLLRYVGHTNGWLQGWPYVAVEDSDRVLALYMPEGTPLGEVYDPARDRHAALPPAVAARFRPSRRGVPGPPRWRRFHTLRLMPPGQAHSVWLFWDAQTRAFLGWYVNLEAPFRRTPIGMDTTDNTLDVVVDPQRHWRWKDADLLAARVEAGLTFPEEAAAFRAEGERVIAAIESRASPFDDAWTGWRARPGWAAPQLPPGWDSLPGADVDLNRV